MLCLGKCGWHINFKPFVMKNSDNMPWVRASCHKPSNL